MSKLRRRIDLPTQILFGLILGTAAGMLANRFGWGLWVLRYVKPFGTAFVRLISLVVVPLVLASLVIGTASLGDPRKLGRVGAKTIVYYLVTTAFSVALGLALANWIEPGAGLPESVKTQLLASYGGELGGTLTRAAERPSLAETLLEIIPTNPIQSLAQGAMLQIIFFAILMGVAISLAPKTRTGTLLAFFEGLNDVMIQIVHLVIRLAPFGVFALITSVVANFGFRVLVSLLKYSLVTIVGLALLNFLYPPLVRILAGMRPSQFMRGIRPAQLIAFSTSSSSATLPVTIQCTVENLGVPTDIASFVLPLGATINMNGTALYQGVSALFIAQVYGMNLTLGDQLTIVLTATLAAIGTAGAPGVGMLMLVIVLRQVGIPLEGIALILGVERFLDMFRTVINITGDASAAVIVAASEGELRPVPSTDASSTARREGDEQE
jgi:proton glutamate symport protein